MMSRTTLVAAACTLALVACSRTPTEETTTPTAPAESATTAMPAPATTAAMPAASTTAMPAASTTAMPAASSTSAAAMPATPAANGKPAATVKDCATTIEGNDAMQFDVGSIAVPASCGKFTINLKHTGTMPVTAMGHNVVISKESDMQGVLADGMGAGAASNYVKPGDARVVAHTKLVGGGQSTSVSFDTSKIKDGGPYEFFCSFPGHAAMMKGTISVQ
jgi:azurin